MTLIKKSLVYLLLVGFGAASFAQENTEAVTSTTSDSEVKIGAKIGYSLGNLSSRSERAGALDVKVKTMLVICNITSTISG